MPRAAATPPARAHLVACARRLPGQIPRLVIMGGGHMYSNCSPAAEFNFWSDPEAARVVLASGANITLVPLDATHTGAMVSPADCEALRALGTRAGDGVPPPQVNVGSDRIGYNDIVEDPDGVVRRALLFLDDGDQFGTAFALQLALR